VSDTPAGGAGGNGVPAQPVAGLAAIPSGLVQAVENLVGTGPVLLGAYTVAELTAVDAIVDFLEARPSQEVLTEAIRSLAARQLLVAGSNGGQVQVQGDLGIAVAFQQRARMVLDARSTGTQPGEPWRILLLPQPERFCLMVQIDALGIHELGLYAWDEALDRLADWLPKGSPAEPGDTSDVGAVLAAAERSALVTVTRYTADGSAETAGASTDVVLARRHDRLHVFSRSEDAPVTPGSAASAGAESTSAESTGAGSAGGAGSTGDGQRLRPWPLDGKSVRETISGLLALCA
jgi:hypothetical protein